ncbi:putative extracellular cellulase allergen asp f7- protein [Neofusicoccum parvum]|nr:putative extracellular cellulase allergen asp f7- protein [Neofusicoccum parvum]
MFLSRAIASPVPAAELNRRQDYGDNVGGAATFYGGNVQGGMCSFSGYTLPPGIRGTALSSNNWENAANCGACVNVKGPKGETIKAMIVDQCPSCAKNQLDLFQGAFTEIANKSAGKVGISWEFVPCGVSGPIRLKNKEGTSQYWFSMQVLNSNFAIDSMQVSTDGGKTWQKTQRAEYNYFENDSGFGTDTVDVKVTSSNGKSIVTKNVKVSGSSSQEADSNF